MKEVISDKLNNFTRALKKLEAALKEKGYSLSLDGIIKRFEFTFEMSWKVLKKVLLYEGLDCFSARDCIKKAFQSNLIEKEDIWLKLLRDRNVSTHIYDEEEGEKIYQRIQELYFPELKKLENVLKGKLDRIEPE